MKKIMSLIQEYIEKKSELEKLYFKLKEELLEKAIAVLVWENENLGTKHDINAKGTRYRHEIKFHENYLTLETEATWAYGGYDKLHYTIPYEKILSDDWKEAVLKEHQRMQDLIKEREKTQLESKERKEYERLKAKYETN